MASRRSRTPTSNALRRRKPGANLSFAAPHIDGLDRRSQRAVACERATWPLDLARRHLLQTIARLAPQVLADLAAVSHPDDHAAIRAWAVQYGVDAQWMLCAARNTLALWELWPKVRGARWEMNFDDEGALVPERGRVPSGPRELLIRSEHFDWLVRSRILGEEKITDPPQTARTAVHKLEHVLGLSTK